MEKKKIKKKRFLEERNNKINDDLLADNFVKLMEETGV